MPPGTLRIAPRAKLRIALALAASLACVGIAGAAQASIGVELVWISTTGSGIPGSSVIEAEPGDELVLEIRIHVDSAGVQGYGLSVLFDDRLMDELDIVSVEELDDIPTLECEPFPSCFSQNPLTNVTMGVVETETESDADTAGLVGSFEAIAKAIDGPVDFMSPVGRITFQVTDNVDTNGPDLEGSVLTGTDGYLDNNLDFVGIDDMPSPLVTPGFAAVSLLPEPGASSLAAGALVTLAWLRRRARTTR